MNEIIKTLEGWFKNLPSLPANAVDGLVSIAPWLALIFGILGILAGISFFGALSVLTPFAMMGGYQGFGFGFFGVIIGIGSSVLMLLSYPGLKAKKMSGWNLFFWSEMVGVVSIILNFTVGGLLGIVIGLYLLFQIKPRYN